MDPGTQMRYGSLLIFDGDSQLTVFARHSTAALGTQWKFVADTRVITMDLSNVPHVSMKRFRLCWIPSKKQHFPLPARPK